MANLAGSPTSAVHHVHVPRFVWILLATAAAAAILALVLVLADNGDSTNAPAAVAPNAIVVPAARYDGGPDEGSAGPTGVTTGTYYGGHEEGQAGR